MDAAYDAIECDLHNVLRNEVSNVPLRALKTSTRKNLCMMLNPFRPIPTKDGFLKDWQGVAEFAKFDNLFIRNLRNNESPTESLLEHWEQKDNVTIGLLIDALTKIGRFDVIDDLSDKFKRDSDVFQSIFGPVNRRITVEMIDGVTVNGEKAQVQVYDYSNLSIIEEDPEDDQHYDAYVCYTEENGEFVKELIEKLEGEFKLCVKDRDLIRSGRFEHQAIIQAIQQRCDKFLVVLSPEFLASAKLEFQTTFAHACSLEERNRKVVPIVYKKCEIPIILKSLTKIDYNCNTFYNFWTRLKASLRSSEGFPNQRLSGSNSLLSIRSNSDGENYVSMPSQSSGYSSFYLQPSSEGHMSNLSLGEDVISINASSFQSSESLSEIDTTMDIKNKKKKKGISKAWGKFKTVITK